MGKANLLLTLLTLLLPSSGVFGTWVNIVVPNDAENQEGNDFSYLPFYAINWRYQQVYDASQFSAIPLGGGYITDILFRADCSHCSGYCRFTNMVLYLSTTARGPDQLSAVFDENLGTNNTRVYGPGLFAFSDACAFNGGPCHSSTPLAFDTLANGFFDLDIPFFYDPAKGNLLMEVWAREPDCNNVGTIANDAVTVAGDSVSRVSGLLDSTTAALIDTTGVVTGFTFVPVPSLTVSLTTNAVVITWPVQPKNFTLYWADKIVTNENWQLFGGQIGGNFLNHIVSLPSDSLDQARFFRLLCSTCEPTSQSNISVKTNSPIAQ